MAIALSATAVASTRTEFVVTVPVRAGGLVSFRKRLDQLLVHCQPNACGVVAFAVFSVVLVRVCANAFPAFAAAEAAANAPVGVAGVPALGVRVVSRFRHQHRRVTLAVGPCESVPAETDATLVIALVVATRSERVEVIVAREVTRALRGIVAIP